MCICSTTLAETSKADDDVVVFQSGDIFNFVKFIKISLQSLNVVVQLFEENYFEFH